MQSALNTRQHNTHNQKASVAEWDYRAKRWMASKSTFRHLGNLAKASVTVRTSALECNIDGTSPIFYDSKKQK